MAKLARQGRQGVQGERGPRGRTGKAGPLNREDVLAIVEDQFAAIRQELALQVKRTAQVQVQLDQIAKAIKRLVP